MVQGLHRLGLKVVLDVVYNHTFHSLMDGEYRSTMENAWLSHVPLHLVLIQRFHSYSTQDYLHA